MEGALIRELVILALAGERGLAWTKRRLGGDMWSFVFSSRGCSNQVNGQRRAGCCERGVVSPTGDDACSLRYG